MSTLATENNPLRVAIVGSGPSGFYAAEELLKSGRHITVDMIDRIPTPFGLVRSGVAPDHPKLKTPIIIFDKVSQLSGFSFFGNVTVGTDISVDELRATHHAILFACGAQAERHLNVPGEELTGSYTATEFVGWYNGHPDYYDRKFDLSQEVAVVIGQGNVAADVVRALTKSVDDLRTTDMAEHALDALAASRVKEIHVIGRRGPSQAKFTNKELKELGELQGCRVEVSQSYFDMNEASLTELADKNNSSAAKNVEILRGWASATTSMAGGKRIIFNFLQSPVALEGAGRLEKLVLERNRLEGAPFDQQAVGTGVMVNLPCGLLFRSIGYRGVPIPGIPFNEKRAIFPNTQGRINDTSGLYTAGWIKRGPSGIIGTNRSCAVETVATLLSDLAALDETSKPGAQGLNNLLATRNIRVVDYDGWKKIDAEEVARGQAKGKPREKITSVADMLKIASA